MKFDESTLYHIESGLSGERYSLYELATWKNGLAFKRIDFSGTGKPVIKIAELNNGISSNTSYTSGDYGEDVALHWDDLLFSWSGNPQTSIDVFRYRLKDGWLNQHIFKVTANEKLVSKNFLYYVLKCLKPVFTEIATNKQTTGLGHVTLADLKRMSLIVPERRVQDRIVSVLKSIDDKIEVNTEINKNLADQIQAIYNNEFDPCTHTPSGVLADICSYSSDRIPVSRLSLSTYFSTENMQPNKMGYVDATSLPSITQTTGCHKGDVLISNIRPYFKKIVYVTDDSCGCSTDVLCFVPKEDQYSAFLFGTLYMDRFFDYMIAGSKGTKMPRGDKQQIMNYPVVLPDKKSLDLFNGLIVPMLDQIATNRAESNRLAALRDALLPKLMSGELDVSELDL